MTPVDGRQVDITVDDGIAWLTFRRPEKRNALTAGMWSALVDGLDDLARRDDVRALGLRGAGGSFSAGADLASLRDASGRESADYRALAEAGLRAVREFPRPTAALVEGPCVGAGCLMALACDVRFTTPASAFAVPATRYGLAPEEGGLARLVEIAGPGQASRFLMSATTWSGLEAAAAGLVEVCSDQAEAAAQDYLRAVAGFDRSVVEATRRAIRRAAEGER